MSNTWLDVLAILVMYCSNHKPGVDDCRVERLHCIKRAVVQQPKAAADDLVNQCISNPKLFPELPKKEEPKAAK